MIRRNSYKKFIKSLITKRIRFEKREYTCLIPKGNWFDKKKEVIEFSNSLLTVPTPTLIYELAQKCLIGPTKNPKVFHMCRYTDEEINAME